MNVTSQSSPFQPIQASQPSNYYDSLFGGFAGVPNFPGTDTFQAQPQNYASYLSGSENIPNTNLNSLFQPYLTDYPTMDTPFPGTFSDQNNQ